MVRAFYPWLQVALTLPLLVASGCKRQQTVSTALVHGELVTRRGWPTTVALVQGNKLVCSGVLVQPQVVLTAAHCIADVSDPHRPKLRDLSSYGVYFGDGNRRDDLVPQFTVKAAGLHDDFRMVAETSKINLTPDLAYVVLDRAPPCLVPSKILRPSDQIKIVDGAPSMRLVGFGLTRCHWTDDGVKRVATTTNVALDEERRKLYVGFDDERLVCHGDSGSGAFVELENGEFRLMGILSQGNDVATSVGMSPGTGVYEPLFDDSVCWLQSKQPWGPGIVCPMPRSPKLDVQDLCPAGIIPRRGVASARVIRCAIRKVPVKRVEPQAAPARGPKPVPAQ